MNIFDKGDYRRVPPNFRTLGIDSLNELTKFQQKFDIHDTDTTINQIRDSIVANYLGYEFLNFSKHGFDDKNSKGKFLEIKQCSFTSDSLGGTWNDTNIEKAEAFKSEKLFTAVAIWMGASDLKFMVYGQNRLLGEYLHKRIVERKTNSRSTQNVTIQGLVTKYGFDIITPPDKNQTDVLAIIANYNKRLYDYVISNKKIRNI